MFIYNVTIKVDWSIHDRWLGWMIETEIPRMLAQSGFMRHQLVRLLEVDEEDGPTYAVQYQTNSLLAYRDYVEDQAAIDNANAYALWGQHALFFTTLMEVVN